MCKNNQVTIPLSSHSFLLLYFFIIKWILLLYVWEVLPILYIDSPYKNGQDFLGIQYVRSLKTEVGISLCTAVERKWTQPYIYIYIYIWGMDRTRQNLPDRIWRILLPDIWSNLFNTTFNITEPEQDWPFTRYSVQPYNISVYVSQAF